MNWKKTFAIVRREYIERVRTKSFWIATLLIPFLFLAYIAFQISSSRKTGGERTIVVVDQTGTLYAPLEKELAATEAEQKAKGSGNKGPHWNLKPAAAGADLEATKEGLRKQVLAKKISGYLVLEPQKVKNDEVEYYSTTVSDFIALNQLERSLNRVRMREKMQDRGLPTDLAGELEKRVDFKAFKVTEKGTSEEKGAGIIAAIIFMVLMYTTFFVYGGQVMRGVIEEKSSRIVEIIIASVRPTELMLGKIIGIGLVGLTQYLVWSFVAMNLSLPGIATVLSSSDMGVPRIPVAMLGYFILFFVLGYFVYASVYTTIAAPFNSEQEATQFVMIPIDPHPRGLHGVPGRDEQPQRQRGALLLPLPLHVLARHVPANGRLRAPRLAGPAVDLSSDRDDGRPRLVRRPRLPRRHPHVRQEAHDPGDPAVGAVHPRQGRPAGGEGAVKGPTREGRLPRSRRLCYLSRPRLAHSSNG